MSDAEQIVVALPIVREPVRAHDTRDDYAAWCAEVRLVHAIGGGPSVAWARRTVQRCRGAWRRMCYGADWARSIQWHPRRMELCMVWPTRYVGETVIEVHSPVT